MGKSCIRFKKIEDVPLDVIARLLKRTPVEKYVAGYEKAFASGAKRRAPRKKTTVKKKAAAKKTAARKKTAAKKATTRKTARKKSARAR